MQLCTYASLVLAATFAFPFVLGLALCGGLPLHVLRPVGATAGKRVDMVYHVALARAFAGAGSRAGVLVLKLNLGALAALDAGVGWHDCQSHSQEKYGADHGAERNRSMVATALCRWSIRKYDANPYPSCQFGNANANVLSRDSSSSATSPLLVDS